MKSTVTPDLRAGVAKVKITPSEPVPLAGFFDRQGLFEGVHDELYARVVIFESEGVEAAIISVDICILSNTFWEDLADRIAHHFPLTKRRVFLNTTHTHGSPAIIDPPGTEFIDISFLNPNPYYDVLERYTESLKEKIIEGIATAHNSMKSVTIGFGTDMIDIGVNRRETNENGTVDIGVDNDGSIDKSLNVLRVDTLDGDTMALIYNNGTHGVSMMSRQLTGDWPGIASQEIENTLGDNTVALFLSGAAGDVNPVYLAKERFDDPDGAAPDLALKVREKVIELAERIIPETRGPVKAEQRIVTLPGKRFLGLLGFDPSYDDKAKDTSPVPDSELRMSALRVGDVFFGGVNAECFSEIGMEFKEKSPFRNTFFAGHLNGYASYVLSDAEMGKGGYEYNATIVKEGGHRAIVDTLLDLAEELKE